MGASLGEGMGDGHAKIIDKALPYQRSIVHQAINQQLGQRLS